MKWSQIVFPKVLGAGFLICTVAEGSQYQDAAAAARRAFVVQSGVKAKVDSLKREYLNQAKTIVKRNYLEEEVAAIGLTAEIIRTRTILIQHNGIDYLIYPNGIKVRFNF